MATTTGFPASSCDASSLDTRVCAEIGAQLAHVRAERGLALDAIGRDLLLSTRQVRALEEADLSAFYGVRYYLMALRKYAALAGIDASLVARAMPAGDRPAPEETLAVRSASEAEPPAWRSWAARAGVVGLLAAASAYVFWSPNSMAPPPAAVEQSPAVATTPPPLDAAPVVAETTPVAVPVQGAGPAVEPPATPAPTAVPPATPDVVAAVPAPPVEPAPSAFGAVRATKATWMFLRYADNTVVERPLADGEQAFFEKAPVYLALGRPDAELVVGSQQVDVAPFVVNGQVRVRASDFARLSGATPTPTAPSAIGSLSPPSDASR